MEVEPKPERLEPVHFAGSGSYWDVFLWSEAHVGVGAGILHWNLGQS